MIRLFLPTSLRSRTRHPAGTVSPHPGAIPGAILPPERDWHCRNHACWPCAAWESGAIRPGSPDDRHLHPQTPPAIRGQHLPARAEARATKGRRPCRFPTLPRARLPDRSAEAAFRCPDQKQDRVRHAHRFAVRLHHHPAARHLPRSSRRSRLSPIHRFAPGRSSCPATGRRGARHAPSPVTSSRKVPAGSGIRRGAWSQTISPSMMTEPDGRSTRTPSFRRT